MIPSIARPLLRCFAALGVMWLAAAPAPDARVQSTSPPPAGKATYDQLKAFTLGGGMTEVKGLVLTRDRVTMTFTGTFYFADAAGGRGAGAVFLGDGTLRAEVPRSVGDFEKGHVRRLLDADLIESDFKTAVLRFSDATAAEIGQGRRAVAAPAQAVRLAADFEPRLLKETGLNLSARLAASILNTESPGVFFAQVDGGRRGRFSYIFDPQHRVPVEIFNINGGEKGLIFAFEPTVLYDDVWMAFYGLDDYERGTATYSDARDLVDVTHYQMDVDLKDPAGRLGVIARMDMTARAPNLQAIPFSLGEGLSAHDDDRLKKQLRVKGARVGGVEAAAIQEDWEGGFTVLLPKPVQAGETLTVEVSVDGDFLHSVPVIPECYYPLINTAWYPRHGYLDRATYDLSFTHQKRHKVAAVGLRTTEEPAPDNRDLMVTKYKMEQPIALAVFALGPFDRKRGTLTFDRGGGTIPLEFNSVNKAILGVKDDFILQELDNAVRYFAAMFGRYPYPSFGAAFHYLGFGQGFPSLLMIPPADRGDEQEIYVFLSHETAHQWWGNIVAWRSYRDQWLSEGFAEYSGMLFSSLRDQKLPFATLLRRRHDSLLQSSRTITGVGKGRLNDVGPIILGHRLNTTQSGGAYQALIYNKGALVLRMLHFLMSNPTTGDDKAFSAMMSAFVERYRDKSASTDDFRGVANEHFARTPIAQKYGLKDLDWFFSQFVYQTPLPSYTLEYQLKEQPDKSVMVSGIVRQEGVPDAWGMVLPIVFTFDANQTGRTTVRAAGPTAPFELKLPARPKKVELDPAAWVLSEKTTTRER